MDNPTLQEYIAKAKAAQLTQEQIIQNLRQAGWPEEAIQKTLVQNINPSGQPQAQPKGKFAQMFSLKKMYGSLPEFLIRFGLAFVFLYAAYFVSNEEVGAKYVPQFIAQIVTQFMPLETFLLIHAISEVLLAIWLLSGVWTKYAALATALLIIAVTLLNLTFFITLFRNVAIIFAALGLFALKMQPDSKE